MRLLADIGKFCPKFNGCFWCCPPFWRRTAQGICKLRGEFGRVMKEGVGEDQANRERIAKLLRFVKGTYDDPATFKRLKDALGEAKAPLLSVVKGNPNDEELAAIIAVVASRGEVAATPPPSNFSLWARRSRLIRPAMQPGPGAWRGSTFPR